MLNQQELGHLFCCDFLSGLKVFGDQVTFDSQARLGFGFCDQAQDGLVAIQRLAGPMFADFTEEPMLNRIPFGSTGRIMANRDLQIEWIGQLLLESVFPGAHPGAVAAAAIGQNQQLRAVIPPIDNSHC